MAAVWAVERKAMVPAINAALMAPLVRFLRARCRHLPKERIIMSDKPVVVSAVALPMRIDDGFGSRDLRLFFVPENGELCTLWEAPPGVRATMNGRRRALNFLFPEPLMRFLMDEHNIRFLMGEVDDLVRRAAKRRRRVV